MNKMILKVVGDGVWCQYDARTQNVLSDVIAKYGVVHMTVQTCGRAKQICQSWYKSLNACDPCVKLACFQPLFTPMFKRFVTLVSQIDMNQALKIKANYGKNGHRAVVNCPQEEYEKLMFSLSLSRAMSGYKGLSIDLSSFLEGSWDKVFVVAASETLCTDFYNEVPMPKCLDVYQAETALLPIIEDEFFSMPIGVLLKKIEELEENSRLHTVYERLVGKILTHGLLPIQPKNPILNGKAPWDWQERVLIIGWLLMLLYIALQWIS